VSLLILPGVFIMVQRKASYISVSLDPEDEQSKYYNKSKN
jgi:hypothetical protein